MTRTAFFLMAAEPEGITCYSSMRESWAVPMCEFEADFEAPGLQIFCNFAERPRPISGLEPAAYVG